jgi:hypothetical protein
MSCPPITVNPASIVPGAVGVAYSQTFSATGGTAPYQFTVTAGTLPAGLTLSTAGVLSGTPTTGNGAGVSITVQARDANNCLGVRAYTIKICPTITLAAISPTIVVGTAYSSSAAASGGATPYVYALTSGALPVGLSLNTTTGAITGTPTSSAAASFTISATDANACVGSRAYAVSPTCPTITVTPTSMANGYVGIAYSQSFTAAGGTAPYTFALTSGTLPAGLTLSTAGLVSGTPTAAVAPASFNVRATDVNGCQSGITAVTLTIKGLCLGNLVFIDMNNNGTRQTTESGVANLSMQLWRSTNLTRGDADDTQVTTMLTDWNGAYQFTGLAPGNYFVRIPTPPVYHPQVSASGVNLDNGINNDSNALNPAAAGRRSFRPSSRSASAASLRAASMVMIRIAIAPSTSALRIPIRATSPISSTTPALKSKACQIPLAPRRRFWVTTAPAPRWALRSMPSAGPAV